MTYFPNSPKNNVLPEKHLYVLGNLTTTTTSTPYRPLYDMVFTGSQATLNTAPSGAGSTVVNLIRNNDPADVIYTASFSAGTTSVSINTERTLLAGDSISLNVSSVATGSPGSDLVFKLKYHN